MKVFRYMSNAEGKGLQVSLGCSTGIDEQLIELQVKNMTCTMGHEVVGMVTLVWTTLES